MQQSVDFLIYIADDDPDSCFLLERILKNLGYQYHSFYNGDQLLAGIRLKQPNLILLDMYLEMDNGLDILHQVKRHYPATHIVMITSYGDIETAVSAIKAGALDYLSKPVDYQMFEQLLKDNLPKYLKLDNYTVRNKEERSAFHDLIGRSSEMQTIYNMIENVGQSSANILILGESGTGKELVASAIHKCGQRSQKPFVEINCGAIPQDLMESEIFGHEKGAFTGAHSKHIGKGEIAHTGTLFLDEICEMDMSLQVKLLRFLQERRFSRVGGSEEIAVDVRIIAATNKNPLSEIAKGRFREDLYYRLNVIPIHMPPLRERRWDIPLLINKFYADLAEETGKVFNDVDSEALEILMQYDWPGNVRELRNVIQRIMVLYDGPILRLSYVPEELRPRVRPMGNQMTLESKSNEFKMDSEDRRWGDIKSNGGINTIPGSTPFSESGDTGFSRQFPLGNIGQFSNKPFGQVNKPFQPLGHQSPPEKKIANQITNLREVEKNQIAKALDMADGKVPKAALALGISRATLYRKMKLYGLKA